MFYVFVVCILSQPQTVTNYCHGQPGVACLRLASNCSVVERHFIFVYNLRIKKLGM